MKRIASLKLDQDLVYMHSIKYQKCLFVSFSSTSVQNDSIPNECYYISSILGNLFCTFVPGDCSKAQKPRAIRIIRKELCLNAFIMTTKAAFWQRFRYLNAAPRPMNASTLRFWRIPEKVLIRVSRTHDKFSFTKLSIELLPSTHGKYWYTLLR